MAIARESDGVNSGGRWHTMAANSWVGAARSGAAWRASRSAQRWTALACLLAGCALAQDLITVHIVPHTHDGAHRANAAWPLDQGLTRRAGVRRCRLAQDSW